MFRRRLMAALATSALLLTALPGAADDPSSPAPLTPPGSVSGKVPVFDAALRALAGDKTFQDSRVGVAIVDVDSGDVLASLNEHLPLNPASNAKVYTAACALATLRGNYRYSTTLHGKVDGSNVDNLVLRGSGDPSLETDELMLMARDLYARGVRRIDGDILVDQRFFDDLTTPPAFEQQPNEWATFRAPVSAVAVNENTVTMVVRPTAPGSPAIVSFEPPGFVDVEGSIRTAESGADTIGLTLEPNGSRLKARLSGAVSVESKVVRYSRRVDDPQLLAGYVLRAALDQVGIKIGGEVKQGNVPTAPLLVRHDSQPLSTLLYALGKQSDNFYAEMVFKSLAGDRPSRASTAADVLTKWLQKNDLFDEGVVVKNGSGLFDANRATALSMAKVLRHMWRDPGVQAEFVAQLSVGGADGTLQKRFKNMRHARIVRAKTGTLDDTIALSGYVLGPPGKGPIAFSVMFNKVAGKGGGARAAADKLVEVIAEQRWRR